VLYPYRVLPFALFANELRKKSCALSPFPVLADPILVSEIPLFAGAVEFTEDSFPPRLKYYLSDGTSLYLPPRIPPIVVLEGKLAAEASRRSMFENGVIVPPSSI
jgi:hypothetical protein